MTQSDTVLLDARVRLDSIPGEGRTIKVETSEDERAALAERLGISTVEALDAKVVAKKFRGGIELSGTLTARITQPCVVTLEPVSQDIEEPVHRVFLPGEDSPANNVAGAEVYIDLEGDDLPDRFDGAELDFSELLIEILSLAIDPYPRKEGAQLPEKARDEGDEDEDSPFAGLRAMQRDRD